MKRQVVVKQKNLYNNQQNKMYEGVVEYLSKDSCTSLTYFEYDGCTKVRVDANALELSIHREGEVTSHLRYAINEKTIGKIMTEFGMIEIELYTHKYIKKENTITIEYDIMQNDEVIDGYRIIWSLKEEGM